mmetsp:Transcript_80075/g.214358  ORF Transcript_80075/g.214358 Transcript_80075/m.214358 type:complete len:124 (-) Transcript_80075:573-944(-)
MQDVASILDILRQFHRSAHRHYERSTVRVDKLSPEQAIRIRRKRFRQAHRAKRADDVLHQVVNKLEQYVANRKRKHCNPTRTFINVPESMCASVSSQDIEYMGDASEISSISMLVDVFSQMPK